MTMARWVLAIVPVCLIAIMVGPACAAEDARPPVAMAKEPLDVKDTRQFFNWYFGMKNKVPAKTEFETEEDYRKRLPWFNDQKTIYFHVQPSKESADSIDGKGYEYDIARQTMTFDVGQNTHTLWQLSYDLPPPDKAFREGLVVLASYETPGRSYFGENAFGKRVLVRTSTVDGYAFAVVNDWLDYRTHGAPARLTRPVGAADHIDLSISLEPEDAERLSKRYEIILGVRPLGFSQCRLCSTTHEPTLNAPFETTWNLYVIAAHLHEIIVRDRSAQSVVRTLLIGPQEKEQGR